jgi:predicted enzyme related to lactoylglutathione lyase
MGTRETFDPGTFSWAELATTDADAAKAFYSKLFGWDYDEDEVPGGGGTYAMAKVEGRYVGAVFQADGPARWNSYITVGDVGETVEKAREAGATIHADPFDVGESGRMAVIQDPTGGVFSVWEPKEHIGAQLVNAHGALTWNDLMTYDVGKAAEFYTEVFEWEVAEVDTSGRPVSDEDDGDEDDDDSDDSDGDESEEGGVTVDPDDATDAPDTDQSEDDNGTERGSAQRLTIRNGERLNGGMATIPEAAGDSVPPHWLPYFAVESIEAAVTAIRDGGGEVMAEPIEVPAGKFAVVADPQGAVFALFRGDLDD